MLLTTIASVLLNESCADSLISHDRAIDGFFAQEFGLMVADPPCGKCWQKVPEALGGRDGQAVDGLSAVHGPAAQIDPATQIDDGQSGGWAHYGERIKSVDFR